MAYQDDSWKQTVGKVAVVYLNQPTDFDTWHLALRRLVTVGNMADSLLYTVPSNQAAAVHQRIVDNQDRAKQMKDEAGLSSSSSSSSAPSATTKEMASSSPKVFVDLTEEVLAPALAFGGGYGSYALPGCVSIPG